MVLCVVNIVLNVYFFFPFSSNQIMPCVKCSTVASISIAASSDILTREIRDAKGELKVMARLNQVSLYKT